MTKRQATPAWGSSYQPAILATPQEAPRISRPAILRAAKVGREMHLLSTPEVSAALLALFCPAVYDIHEQRLLSTVPACHPLLGSPRHDGLPLPATRGTVQVAESMGALAQHPKLFLRGKDDDGIWVPFPYCGDLLLFLEDAAGPYCINWNIKLRPEDYCRPGYRLLGRTRMAARDERADLRHKIEETYYEDIGVRTIRVTSEDINPTLVANLRAIFGWHSRHTNATAADRELAVEAFRESIGGSRPSFHVVQDVSTTTGLSIHDSKAIFYQAIWNRDLLVDLFVPLLIDQPLASPRQDPLGVHTMWFQR